MLFLDFLSTGEAPVCLADATKLLASKPNGRHLSIRSIERYILVGYGPDDAKVFLEGARVGTSWVTSKEALQRFVKACTVADQERRQAESQRQEPAHA